MFALTAEEQDRLVNIAICPICFSSGKGVGFHLPNHSYEIVVRVRYFIHCIKDLQKRGGGGGERGRGGETVKKPGGF